jgi:hypothetical protein
MVRILRAYDPMVYKSLQRGNPPAQTFGQKTAGDAQVQGLLALAETRVVAWNAAAAAPLDHSKIPRS